MKILVTGTAGFIGFHLANYLLNRRDEVVGLDSVNDYYDIRVKYGRLSEAGVEDIEYGELSQSRKYKNYRFIKLNLEDREALRELFRVEKFDMVCNLAAQAGVRYSLENPYAYISSNIDGFMNILECSREFEIKNLVYASSSSVYGLNSKMPFSTEDRVDTPISLYAATKKSNELMAHTYSHLYKIPTTGLRFFTVYGPWGRPDMALFLFTKAILEDREIDVFNNGDMLRDFTYIDDIVKGVVKTIDNPARENENRVPYKVYNIGNNNPVKLLDFIEAIERVLKKSAKKRFLPIQAGDVAKTYADVSDLIEDLNYKPDTDIEYGVREFVKWYREFFEI